MYFWKMILLKLNNMHVSQRQSMLKLNTVNRRWIKLKNDALTYESLE